MKRLMMGLMSVWLFLLFGCINGFALEKEFDSVQLMNELEEKLKLSSEKLSELKPLMDTKSEELRKLINEGIDKGFLQLEEFNSKLDDVSRDAEEKVQNFLTSEEYIKFKEFMGTVDKQALKEAKNKLVEELSAFLELTEDQVEKLRPILEDTVEQLNQAFTQLAVEGGKNWDMFKEQYEKLLQDFREKIEETLDTNQLEKLDEYNKQKINKIKDELIEV